MSNFYSSLIINSKNFPRVHQVFKPRYNKEFFRRVTANIGQLEEQIKQRCKYPDPNLTSDRLKELNENSKKLVKLKERFEKTQIEGEDENKFKEILNQLELIEDRLMPTAISIPNRASKLVPEEDIIVDEIKSDFQAKQNLVKILSHRKLSYINNCYSKSVVGPNSHYYFGIGAKLQHALTSYFTQELESFNFIPVSGLCLTKSAVVEATNSRDCKDYFEDPARIVDDDTPKYTTLHLTESSRESLVAFVSTLGPISSNNPLRLMTSGACYRPASDWFDGDDKRITQSETVHALVLNSSIEQYSMQEYHKIRDLIWSSYKKLQLPARLIHLSTDSMFSSEFDSHRIDLWLPSRGDWIQAARISHYRDYLTIRTGMKRGHLVDSMVSDGQLLFASIVENRQTAQGKFIIPEILSPHMSHNITSSERSTYLQGNLLDHLNSSGTGISQPLASRGLTNVLTNHEQRRYLVKRHYYLSHSKKAKEIIRKRDGWALSMFKFVCLSFFIINIDWESIWFDYMSDKYRSFIYDKLYRPARYCWWYIIHEEETMPLDLAYSEIDKSNYIKGSKDRTRDIIMLGSGRKEV